VPGLRVLSGSQVRKIAAEQGFEPVRQKGNHPLLAVAVAILACASCGRAAAPSAAGSPASSAPPLELTSPAFRPGGRIPARHWSDPFQAPDGSWLCEGHHGGENVSPALEWKNVPPGTQSLALIMHLKWQPVGTYESYWVIYRIPPTATGLPEGVPADLRLADGSFQGVNGNPFRYNVGYAGPCPGHRATEPYAFRLYALDARPDLAPGATADELLEAMQGHILAEAELVGKARAP
jgi:hypothetical protein